MSFTLSTPHGALGTIRGVFEAYGYNKLSTPHGALGTSIQANTLKNPKQLSTPHGALGTSNDHIKQNKTYQ